MNSARMRGRMAKALALMAPFLLYTVVAAGADCDALLKEHLRTDLDLPYADFDQTKGKGFRILGDAGCNEQAAQLIDAYIAKNHPEQSSPTWHAAQMHAMAGDYPVAIRDAKAVLLDKEDFSKDPLRWNDYVLATIAFLQHDKATLIEHRNKVAEGAEAFWGNKTNLRFLDGLVAHFDQPYAYAYMHPQKD